MSRVFAWIRYTPTVATSPKNALTMAIEEETFAQACPIDPFRVGMCSWVDCPGNADVANLEPHPELELSVSPLPTTSAAATASAIDQPHPPSFSGCNTSERFAFATDEELAKLAEGVVPANTAKITNWALKNFQLWMTNRNISHPNDLIPSDIFQCTDTQTLSKYLSRFVVETRKSNGELYPPATLHQLLCGILRHTRSKNPTCPNFLDKKDSRFRDLHGTLDSYFHKLHSDGVGTQTKHAETISCSEEDKLWSEGVMDTNWSTECCLFCSG